MLSSLLSCFCNSFREMLRLLQTVLILSLCIRTVHSCVSNYFLFEELTFGNNSENRLKLYQAFYRPNKHLPYSVEVTYQSISNGTRINISTDPSCPHEQVWIWLAHPIFVIQEPVFLNRLTLLMLNYFEEWKPPHVKLAVPYPCQGQAEAFLEQMTTSVGHLIGVPLCVEYVCGCVHVCRCASVSVCTVMINEFVGFSLCVETFMSVGVCMGVHGFASSFDCVCMCFCALL